MVQAPGDVFVLKIGNKNNKKKMSFILTSGKKKKHAYSAWLFLVLVHKGEEVIYRGRNRGKKKDQSLCLKCSSA